MEQHRFRRRLCAFERCERRAIHQINVEPAVIVVIEKADARTIDFDDRGLLRRACTMFERGEAGLSCVVLVDDRGAVDKTARSNWAMTRVVNRRVLAACHDPRGLGRFRLLMLEGTRQRARENWSGCGTQQRKQNRATIQSRSGAERLAWMRAAA